MPLSDDWFVPWEKALELAKKQYDSDEYFKTPLIDKFAILLKALREIIEECPNPKLPYGQKVVEIAKKAIEDINES